MVLDLMQAEIFHYLMVAGSTQELHDTSLTAEKEYSINFTELSNFV